MISVLVLCVSLVSSEYNRADWISQSSWTKTRKMIVEKNKKPFGWIDNYTRDTVALSKNLDLDHVVPLEYAFTHGGDKFSVDLKHKFATDTHNLILASPHENRSKGDKGVLEYLPKHDKCRYLADWKYMVTTYKLNISTAEWKIINSKCE